MTTTFLANISQSFADMMTQFERDNGVTIQVDSGKLRVADRDSNQAVKIAYMHHFTEEGERSGSWQALAGKR